MSDTINLKYSAELDNSKFLAAAKAAQKAAQDIGQAVAGGSSGGGGGAGGGGSVASSLKNQNQLLDKHSQIVANIAGKYRQLESARNVFDKQPGVLKDIGKQQVSLLKNLERQAKSEGELTKIMQARVALQQKLSGGGAAGSGGGGYSQRQYEMLKGILGSQFVSQVGQSGRALYAGGMGNYQSLNEQYGFDKNLTASQRNLTRSQLALGQQLAPYQSLKNNALAGLYGSPIGAPLAIAGDVAGAVGPWAASAIQLKALMSAGKMGGAAAGAAATATGGGIGIGEAAAGAAGGAGLIGKVGLGGLAKGLGAAGLIVASVMEMAKTAEMVANNPKFNKAMTEAVSKGTLSEKEAESLAEARKAHLMPFGTGLLAGIGKISAEEEAKLLRKAGVDANGNAGGSVLDLVRKNSPTFAIDKQRQANTISDFKVDQAIRRELLGRNYGRQTEDIGIARGREAEDYSVTQKKLGISRGRAEFDYDKAKTRAVEDNSRTVQRLTFDTNKARFRSDQDYAIATQKLDIDVSRTKRNYLVESSRTEEDYTRNRGRLIQDSTRQLVRLQEDAGRDLGRLEEDTNRERLRSAQDYARSRQELERNTARSVQDLNRNLGDSLLSILAPNMAGSKGYQVQKLFRDYNIQKKRLGENYQFENQGLNLGYSRTQEDIARQSTRGHQDIGRELGRGQEDISRERARGEEDLAREKSRAEFDQLTQATDALKNAQLSLTETNIGYSRQLQDIGTEYSRGIEDATREFSRGMADIETEHARTLQDLDLATADAARQHQRALQDLALQEKRAGEDYATELKQMAIEQDRFVRDFNLNLKQAELEWTQKLGLAGDEAKKLFEDLRASLPGGGGNNPNPSSQQQRSTGSQALDNVLGWFGNNTENSHALGLKMVPVNNYPARLHQGEMVVPARDASAIRATGYDPVGGQPLSHYIDFTLPKRGKAGAGTAASSQSFSGIGPDTLDHRNRPQDLVGFDIAAGRKQVMDSEAFQSTHGYLTPVQMLKGIQAIKAGRDPNSMSEFAPPQGGARYGASAFSANPIRGGGGGVPNFNITIPVNVDTNRGGAWIKQNSGKLQDAVLGVLSNSGGYM